ncbi:uncharacterized protein WCC33_000683 [Rhinophrynus dorsalis]
MVSGESFFRSMSQGFRRFPFPSPLDGPVRGLPGPSVESDCATAVAYFYKQGGSRRLVAWTKELYPVVPLFNITDFSPENKAARIQRTPASMGRKSKVVALSGSDTEDQEQQKNPHSSSSDSDVFVKKAPRGRRPAEKSVPKSRSRTSKADIIHSSSSSSSDSSPDRISSWKKKDEQRQKELEERRKREQEHQLRLLREEEREDEERKKKEKSERGDRDITDSDNSKCGKGELLKHGKIPASSSDSEEKEKTNKEAKSLAADNKRGKKNRNRTVSYSETDKTVKKIIKKSRASELARNTKQEEKLDEPKGRCSKLEKGKKKPELISGRRVEKKEPTVEEKLQKLHNQIKFALKVDNPDVQKCLAALEELGSLQVTSQILQKNTDFVATLKKIRRYKANQSVMDKAAEVYTVIKARILGPKPEYQQKRGERASSTEKVQEEAKQSEKTGEDLAAPMNGDSVSKKEFSVHQEQKRDLDPDFKRIKEKQNNQ